MRLSWWLARKSATVMPPALTVASRCPGGQPHSMKKARTMAPKLRTERVSFLRSIGRLSDGELAVRLEEPLGQARGEFPPEAGEAVHHDVEVAGVHHENGGILSKGDGGG